MGEGWDVALPSEERGLWWVSSMGLLRREGSQGTLSGALLGEPAAVVVNE